MESLQTEPLTQETKPKPETKSSTLSLIKDFCDYTSCHGLGRTAVAKYLVQRIAWFLLFLGALAVAIYQVRELYVKFGSRPVGTTIKLTNKASLRFPQVTICNFNPIQQSLVMKMDPELYQDIVALSRKDDKLYEEDVFPWPTQKTNLTLRESEDESQDEDDQQEKTRRSLKQPINGEEDAAPFSNKNDQEANDDYDSKHGDDEDNYGDDDDDFPEDPSALLASHKQEQEMSQFVSRIDEDRGYRIGHQFDDSVLACSYRGMDCKNKMLDHWGMFWHYKYGNCFMFNEAKNTSKKPLKSNKAGPAHGLSLTLFVDQANYMSQFTKKAGYKILINPQGLMTFPYEEGINVSPGVSSYIGMRKTLIKRVDPFNNNSCHDTTRSDEGNIYYMNFRTNYSNTACRESCLAYNQRKYCNCVEFRFPVSKDTPECNVFNITAVKCLRKVLARFKDNKLNCSKECTPACEQEHFKLLPSYAAWPSKKYEEEINKGRADDLNQKIKFSDNYLKVRIFYEQLNYEVMEEVISYGLVDFVSDIGGQLGLWLGVSVLAAAEVIELIILIFFYFCKKEKKTKEAGNEKETIPLKDEMELPTITNV